VAKSKLYVLGVDQMLLPLTKYFAREGSIPNIARLMERGAVFQTLASFPCYTANNWQVIASAPIQARTARLAGSSACQMVRTSIR